MNSFFEYLSQVGRIIFYLFVLATKKAGEMTAPIRTTARQMMFVIKVTALIMLALPVLCLVLAFTTRNSTFLGVAGMTAAFCAFVLNLISRPLTALIELIDLPVPAFKRRFTAIAGAWHSGLMGLMYTIGLMTTFYMFFPFAQNFGPFVAATLAMLTLWIAGQRVPFLRATFNLVGYVFAILVFLASCFVTVFPKSTAAFREEIEKADSKGVISVVQEQWRETATALQSSWNGWQHQVEQSSNARQLASEERNRMKELARREAAARKERKRIGDANFKEFGLYCEEPFMKVLKYDFSNGQPMGTGILVNPGDTVISVSTGTLTLARGWTCGPDGGWPPYLSPATYQSCADTYSGKMYNLLMYVEDPPRTLGQVVLEASRGPIVDVSTHGRFIARNFGNVFLAVNRPDPVAYESDLRPGGIDKFFMNEATLYGYGYGVWTVGIIIHRNPDGENRYTDDIKRRMRPTSSVVSGTADPQAVSYAPTGSSTETPATTQRFTLERDFDTWQDTGLEVASGNSLECSATGSISFGTVVESGPEGLNSEVASEEVLGTCLFPNNAFAVIGRIVGPDGVESQSFIIGNSSTVTSLSEGKVEVRLNTPELDAWKSALSKRLPTKEVRRREVNRHGQAWDIVSRVPTVPDDATATGNGAFTITLVHRSMP